MNTIYYLSLEKNSVEKGRTNECQNSGTGTQEQYLFGYLCLDFVSGEYSLAKFYIERAVDNLPKEEETGVILEHYGDILWMSGAEYEAKAMSCKSHTMPVISRKP